VIREQTLQRLLSAIDEGEVVELTSKLVNINSVFDPDSGTDESRVAMTVARWASNEGLEVEVEEVARGRPNVIIRLGPTTGTRRLILEGHTDVVTPGDLSAWSHDPFEAKLVGRRLYGRGTNDTKGNLAAMLTAMAAIKRCGIRLKGQIIGAVLCDEEGLMLGVQDFIKRGHADGVTGAIICEPQDLRICCTQKGALRIRYFIRGKMSHGAMPLDGLNPIAVVSRILDGLEHCEGDIINNIDPHPLLGWPSITPTVLRAPAIGPGQLNVVPESAEVLVDVRTIPGQDHPRIIEDLKRVAARAREGAQQLCRLRDMATGAKRHELYQVEFQVMSDRPHTQTDPQDPLVKAVEWATRLVTQREPVYDGVPGTTDGTYLWALKGIPIVTIGAGAREVPHQVDEWVDVDQLLQVARIYAVSAVAYLQEDHG
jgi:succinyl-diaminopimelate desuccinylase